MTEERSQYHHAWIAVAAAAFVAANVGCGRLPSAQSSDLMEISDAEYASPDGLAPCSLEAQERQRQAVQQTGLPLEVKTRKVGMVFRLIPSGTFVMGSPSSERERASDEMSHH